MNVTEVPRDEIFLLFTLQEVAAAMRALDEVERLAAVRIQRAPHITVREGANIYAAIRFALHLAGSVSRVFWPPRNKTRGEHMRQLLGLPDNHGLKDRRLRDHIEHMDERLDTWTAQSPRPYTGIDFVFHDDFPDLAREAVINSTVVIYDEVRRQVSVLGETFDLAALRLDLLDVRERTSTAFRALYPGDAGK